MTILWGLEIDESSDGSEPFSIAVIAVTIFESRVVVALPRPAWHRTVKQRLLSPRALTKAVLVQGTFVDRSEAGTDLQGQYPFWLGILAPEFEDLVTFDPEAELPDCINSEGPLILPTAESLAELAEKHFGFVSATSGGGPAGARKAASLDQRLAALEQSVGKLMKKFQDPATTQRPPAIKQNPKLPGFSPPPGLQPEFQPVEGLDLEVVRSARAAGIPEEQIKEMASVALQGRPRLADLPAPSRKRPTIGVLSESEDEADMGLISRQEASGAAASDEMTAAVTELGRLVRRCWRSRNGGVFNFSRLQEVFGCLEGSEENPTTSTGGDQQSGRKEHDRRFSHDGSIARRQSNPCLYQGVAGDEIQSPELCHSRSDALGGGWHDRCYQKWKNRGSKSEGVPPFGPGGPALNRSRVLDSGVRKCGLSGW